jgi:hypothetical protein
LLEWQQKILVESSKQSSSPQKLVKTQGSFLHNLEGSIIGFRSNLRKLFEKVLNALEDGDQSETRLKRETEEFLNDIESD